ncbi:MAG TPA: hypothetical protein VFW24_16800 [Acidimicrobiales bacterium]|nr:hypothetical protein [Acidimicrobiales bacterium]
MAAPEITAEEHAPPVVLAVAATLRRSASQPRLARRMARLSGVMALRSSVDTQAVTIRFGRGRVALARGVAPDAAVVVTLDFNNMSGPDAPKPKVKGAARHPLFALGASAVLEPPHGTWQEEAQGFWEFAGRAPRMPSSILVVCTDDDARLRLGEPDGEPAYELHGAAATLVAVFSGEKIIGEEFLAGRLRGAGTFEHASVLTGRSIAWTFGQDRREPVAP